MAGEPALKVPRLAQLKAELPNISCSALSSALTRIKPEDLVMPGKSRRAIKRAQQRIVDMATPVGSIIESFDLDSARIAVQHPAAMLYTLGTHSTPFATVLRDAARRSPPTLLHPWRVVVYMDEVSPGNTLAYRHARKSWAVYWSILELGANVLWSEERALHC